MAKQGMKRMERTHTQPRNEQAAVPEIQGKAKHSNVKANPIIAGTKAPSLKVYHTTPFEQEKPISPIYSTGTPILTPLMSLPIKRVKSSCATFAEVESLWS